MHMLAFAEIITMFSYKKDLKRSEFVAEHDKIWFDGPHPSALEPHEIELLERHYVSWDEENEGWHVFT